MIKWILPLGFILAGLLAGIIAEKIVFTKLKTFAARQLPGNEILFRSLQRITFTWFVLAGFYGAIRAYKSLIPDIAEVLQTILTIVFLYSITIVIARLIAGFIRLYSRRNQGVSASLLSNLATTIVLILGTLIILQTIGIQITPILTTLGIGGLAVGLALQDTLANLFSGVYLIMSKQVRTGDYVKLEDKHEGYITDITWRNTTIKELSNNVIIVPNSKLASAIFTNYHLPVKEITLTINVGVDYESDLEEVERVTVEVAKKVLEEVSPELLENEPFLRFHTFGDSSIDFTVFMRVNEFFDQRIAKHKFIKQLHKRYQQEKIKIPFPIREVYAQGNQTRNGHVVVTEE
ncbi:mechanosensitive ion channel family protein [Scytonema hofmannii FACHB-248]|uniref:Mechanosensitive ion channel family protein n=1 Tax=Scytonema hofmannii FACHB-248 TaxID=1842502 RepID=A0ABR8GQL9_9CYAN|nr:MULTISPECIES: mechanosensitive ion channel family protein [Nostocales]MBD2605682.1 mechanosensitive ion channel family protein [Scytonema hofmannii FACHB-248]